MSHRWKTIWRKLSQSLSPLIKPYKNSHPIHHPARIIWLNSMTIHSYIKAIWGWFNDSPYKPWSIIYPDIYIYIYIYIYICNYIYIIIYKLYINYILTIPFYHILPYSSSNSTSHPHPTKRRLLQPCDELFGRHRSTWRSRHRGKPAAWGIWWMRKKNEDIL